ncbi:MAG: amidohydrolase family protein [Candidatus Geothermincolia bacterium]
MKVIDAHAHLELPIDGLTPQPARKRQPKGFMWQFELLRFNPLLWPLNAMEPFRTFISVENQFRLSMGSPENLLSFMDRNGIGYSVVHPVAPFTSSASYLGQCSGNTRLIPFASACPGEDWEGRLKEALDAGCRGVKIHPILQRLAPEDEFYFQLAEVVRPYKKPILSHTGVFDYYTVADGYKCHGDVRRFEPLVKAFPDLPFIFGHSGLAAAAVAVGIASRYPNVYLETSFQSAGRVKRALEELGGERVMFGSDWPESNQKTALGIARRVAGADRDLLDGLLWRNIEQLIGPVED